MFTIRVSLMGSKLERSMPVIERETLQEARDVLQALDVIFPNNRGAFYIVDPRGYTVQEE